MNRQVVKVWDPLVRIFHWSLLLLFIIAYLSGEESEGLHATAGYAIIGLLAFRILWGLVGTRHARFTDFIYSPSTVASYLKSLALGRPKHYLGHNPAGGVMVIVLLLSLLASTASGLKAYGAEGHGPLAGGGPSIVSTAYADDDHDEWHGHEDGEEGEELWEEVHEFFVNFTLVLVFVHIAGALASSYLHRENLVLAMITGKKSIGRD